MLRIKKNDTVKVISGKHKGKEGQVIELSPKKEKIRVKGVAIVTRHLKPRQQGQPGTIKKEESFILLCKVMPVCPACKKPCRVGVKELADGSRARVCKRCQETW